jgi:hypothetical protein
VFIDYPVFASEFSSHNVRVPKPNETSLQKAAVFIMVNGNHDMRDLPVLISKEYTKNSLNKSGQWESVVLIICMCCIAITVIISVLIIPVIFTLENEH